MKVILNENVENLGSVGQVVKVRDGFARNFLIPRGHAVVATESNVKAVEQAKAKEIKKENENLEKAKVLAEKIRETALTFEASVGDEGKLFGSVTSADLEELLKKSGVEVDKKDIRISRPIRKVGMHDIEVRCYTNVKAFFRLSVVEKKKNA